jgi:hypothetical protein
MKFFLSRLKTALTNQNFLCQELLRRVWNRLKKSFLTDLKGLFCTSECKYLVISIYSSFITQLILWFTCYIMNQSLQNEHEVHQAVF